MKRKTLLLIVMTALITGLQAQKAQKQLPGYAITSEQKGKTGWKEVRLVDVRTGQELKTVYQGTQEIEILNARTGKPVVKKDVADKTTPVTIKKVINLDNELDKANGARVIAVHKVVTANHKIPTDKPF